MNIYIYKIKVNDGYYITTDNDEATRAWQLQADMEVELLS